MRGGHDIGDERGPAPMPVPVTVGPRRADQPRAHSGDDVMPARGPLVDRFGRVHRDLRLSITDRCNLRCTYCMPDEGMTFLPRDETLTLDELTRVAGVAVSLGIRAIRLTGGEPLVRRGVVELVGRLAALGLDDIGLTTNGMLLGPLALPLAAAGLTRVNISCDSLRADRFAAVRHRGDLATVLASMDGAEAAGLRPLKVNVVLVRGVNDDEVLDFAGFARTTGRVVRFIEFMPLDHQGDWSRTAVVPGREVLEVIGSRWPLEAVGDANAAAPATRYRFTDGAGEIGVISSVTEPFCGTCDRLRITADGSVRNCLFSDEERSLRDVLRNGGGDDELELALRVAVWAKLPGHAINEPSFLRPRRSMSMIGG